MLPAAQAGPRQARHASRDTSRSRSRLTGDGLFRPAEHRFYRASESDHPPCNSRAGSSKLGDGSADPTPVSSPGVVACVLSFRASSPIPTSSAHAATRARWQTDCATLPPANSGDGSRQNTSTMDGARGALLPPAAGFRLRATKARGGCRVISRVDWYMCQQKRSDGASLREKKACLDLCWLLRISVPNKEC